MSTRFDVAASGVLTLVTAAGAFIWVDAEVKAMAVAFADFGAALPGPTQLVLDLFATPPAPMVLLVVPFLLWGLGAITAPKSELLGATLLLSAAPAALVMACLCAVSLALPVISIAGAIK